jgi:hypothetical protein
LVWPLANDDKRSIVVKAANNLIRPLHSSEASNYK